MRVLSVLVGSVLLVSNLGCDIGASADPTATSAGQSMGALASFANPISSRAAIESSVRAVVEELAAERGSLPTCPTFSSADPDLECGNPTCNGDNSVVEVSCTGTNDKTVSCGGTEYTVDSGATVGVEFDLTEVTVNREVLAGTMKTTVNAEGTVTGGNLTGGVLDCNVQFTQSLPLGLTSFTPNCDYENYSCTYTPEGGAAVTIPCANLGSAVSCAAR